MAALTHYNAPVAVAFRITDRDTGEVVRYAGVEYHAELTDVENEPRTITKATMSTSERTSGSTNAAAGTERQILTFN